MRYIHCSFIQHLNEACPFIISDTALCRYRYGIELQLAQLYSACHDKKLRYFHPVNMGRCHNSLTAVTRQQRLSESYSCEA